MTNIHHPGAEDYVYFLKHPSCINCPYYSTDTTKGLIREHEFDLCLSLNRVLSSQHIEISSPEDCPILLAMKRRRAETDYINRTYRGDHSFQDDYL